MRLINADALVFEYGGLAKIHPSDGYAIAEYFANQVKAMPTAVVGRVRKEGDGRVTKEEAIDTIKHTMIYLGRSNKKTQYFKALRMAIKALEQPELKKEMIVSFVREIDKETAEKIKQSMAKAPVMLLAIEQDQTCDGCQCPPQMCETCKRAYGDKYVGGEASE